MVGVTGLVGCVGFLYLVHRLKLRASIINNNLKIAKLLNTNVTNWKYEFVGYFLSCNDKGINFRKKSILFLHTLESIDAQSYQVKPFAKSLE